MSDENLSASPQRKACHRPTPRRALGYTPGRTRLDPADLARLQINFLQQQNGVENNIKTSDLQPAPPSKISADVASKLQSAMSIKTPKPARRGLQNSDFNRNSMHTSPLVIDENYLTKPTVNLVLSQAGTPVTSDTETTPDVVGARVTPSEGSSDDDVYQLGSILDITSSPRTAVNSAVTADFTTGEYSVPTEELTSEVVSVCSQETEKWNMCEHQHNHIVDSPMAAIETRSSGSVDDAAQSIREEASVYECDGCDGVENDTPVDQEDVLSPFSTASTVVMTQTVDQWAAPTTIPPTPDMLPFTSSSSSPAKVHNTTASPVNIPVNTDPMSDDSEVEGDMLSGVSVRRCPSLGGSRSQSTTTRPIAARADKKDPIIMEMSTAYHSSVSKPVNFPKPISVTDTASMEGIAMTVTKAESNNMLDYGVSVAAPSLAHTHAYQPATTTSLGTPVSLMISQHSEEHSTGPISALKSGPMRVSHENRQIDDDSVLTGNENDRFSEVSEEECDDVLGELMCGAGDRNPSRHQPAHEYDKIGYGSFWNFSEENAAVALANDASEEPSSAVNTSIMSMVSEATTMSIEDDLSMVDDSCVPRLVIGKKKNRHGKYSGGRKHKKPTNVKEITLCGTVGQATSVRLTLGNHSKYAVMKLSCGVMQTHFDSSNKDVESITSTSKQKACSFEVTPKTLMIKQDDTNKPKNASDGSDASPDICVTFLPRAAGIYTGALKCRSSCGKSFVFLLRGEATASDLPYVVRVDEQENITENVADLDVGGNSGKSPVISPTSGPSDRIPRASRPIGDSITPAVDVLMNSPTISRCTTSLSVNEKSDSEAAGDSTLASLIYTNDTCPYNRPNNSHQTAQRTLMSQSVGVNNSSSRSPEKSLSAPVSPVATQDATPATPPALAGFEDMNVFHTAAKVMPSFGVKDPLELRMKWLKQWIQSPQQRASPRSKGVYQAPPVVIQSGTSTPFEQQNIRRMGAHSLHPSPSNMTMDLHYSFGTSPVDERSGYGGQGIPWTPAATNETKKKSNQKSSKSVSIANSPLKRQSIGVMPQTLDLVSLEDEPFVYIAQLLIRNFSDKEMVVGVSVSSVDIVAQHSHLAIGAHADSSMTVTYTSKDTVSNGNHIGYVMVSSIDGDESIIEVTSSALCTKLLDDIVVNDVEVKEAELEYSPESMQRCEPASFVHNQTNEQSDDVSSLGTYDDSNTNNIDLSMIPRVQSFSKRTTSSIATSDLSTSDYNVTANNTTANVSFLSQSRTAYVNESKTGLSNKKKNRHLSFSRPPVHDVSTFSLPFADPLTVPAASLPHSRAASTHDFATLPSTSAAKNSSRSSREFSAKEEGAKRSHMKDARHVYFRQDVCDFGTALTGSMNRMKIELCNATDDEVTVSIGDPTLPFVLLHNEIKLLPHSFVRIPIRYVPVAGGSSFASSLVAQVTKVKLANDKAASSSSSVASGYGSIISEDEGMVFSMELRGVSA